MKMLLFKPELGTLKIINHPEDGPIENLVEDKAFHGNIVVIDDVSYIFYVGFNSSIIHNKFWSFYQISSDQCLYGNIVIEKSGKNKSKDITAEDILNIKGHIVVNPKGYMIYLQ